MILEKCEEENRMRKYKNFFISCLFLVVLSCVLHPVANLLEKKTGVKQFGGFWEEEERQNVWFLGNSHMYYSMLPMELWEDFGITSYLLASSRACMPQNYWILRCALAEKEKPDVVVLDTYHVAQEVKVIDEQLPHFSFDLAPLSITKAQMTMDLFDSWETRIEYLMPFYVYHNRWDQLTEDDFDPYIREMLHGGKFKEKVESDYEYTPVGEDEIADSDTTGHIYLRKIIELCQKEGIQVVITGIPSIAGGDKGQKAMNRCALIAEEYDVPFLNMVYEDVTNFGIDYADPGHTNISGSLKVTEYIGEFLKENCTYTDYAADEEICEKWDAYSKEWHNYKKTKLKTRNALRTFLVYCRDADYRCKIYVKDQEALEKDKVIYDLVNNVYDAEFIEKEEAVSLLGKEFDGEYFIQVISNHTEKVVDMAVFKDQTRQK